MAINQEAVKFIEISESSFDALSSANINPNAFYVVRKNNGGHNEETRKIAEEYPNRDRCRYRQKEI